LPDLVTSHAVEPVLQVVGTVAFAISGTTAAARRAFDWFGAVALGTVVAVGGGTVRDALLGLPASWLHQWWPLVVAAMTAVLTIPVVHRIGSGVDGARIVLIADALGLAVFTVLGADRASHAGAPAPTAAVLGALSGVAGGVLRDILCGTAPVVFSGQVYALASLSGAALYVTLRAVEVGGPASYWLPVLTIVTIRLVALRRAWSVPAVRGPA
jgi:uncharacterized membrane protein YeiH